MAANKRKMRALFGHKGSRVDLRALENEIRKNDEAYNFEIDPEDLRQAAKDAARDIRRKLKQN